MLHEIIQKNMETFENADFRVPDEASARSIANFGDETLHLELVDWKRLKQFLLSSQLSIIQAIDEMIEEVMEKKEQVHGFQTYHTCDEECEVNCKRLRDERKIFFDGWDDGRNLMKIDLMRIRSFLNTKTKLQ
jgi:hypothetical protein